MEHVFMGMQRTFPKKGSAKSSNKTTATGCALKSERKKRRIRRKGRTTKHFNSIFYESEDDFSDDCRVEVQRQPRKPKMKKIRKQENFAARNLEKSSQEEMVAEEGEFDTYVPPVDDGFDTWIPPPPEEKRKRKTGKFYEKKRTVFAEKNAEKKPQAMTTGFAAQDNFDTYVPASNDGFDTWIPPPPVDNRWNKKKFHKNRVNSWKRPIQDMFGEESSSTAGIGSNVQMSAAPVQDENKANIKSEVQEPSDDYLDEGKAGFVGPKTRGQSAKSSAKNSEGEGAVAGAAGFREEIANLPLGKAKQLQERLGTKLFDKAFFNQNPAHDLNKPPTQQNFVRDNPKRPREVSSKMPVSKFRNVFENEKLERPKLDPRFDSRCGEFNDYIYRNNYGFLNEIRQEEKKVLMKELKEVKGEDEVESSRLKEALRKMDNQEKAQANADRRKEVMRQIRHENNERMRQGLPPIYRTRAQIKWLEWQKKYDELKGGKKLDKYLRRKAKKQDRKRGVSESSLYDDDEEAGPSGSGLNETVE